MVLCMLLTIIMIEFKYFNVKVFPYIIIIIIIISIIVAVVIKLSAVIIHFEAHMT